MAGTAPLGAEGGAASPCWPRITPPVVVENHASTEIGCVLEPLVTGYGITLLGKLTNWLMPFKLNACPTMPDVKFTPFCGTPLLFPIRSLALPSPVYQAIIPSGGGIHCCPAIGGIDTARKPSAIR